MSATGPNPFRFTRRPLAMPLFALLALLLIGLQLALRMFAQDVADVGTNASQQNSRLSPRTRAQRFLRSRVVRRVTALDQANSQGTSSHRATAAEQLALARAQTVAMQTVAMQTAPRTSLLSVPWTPVGPAQILSSRFGLLTGRVTALALDPADATGNTLYLGSTGGGVWKSVNAAAPVGQVSFAPLTDNLPVFSLNAGSSATASLSIGSLAIANGVLLAGTGDPNDATDSYFGSGILRSVDGGATWTLAQGSQDGAAGNHTFFGLSVAGLAFSSATPSLVVAALSDATGGDLENAPDQNNSVRGLYYSADAGVTWHMASIFDGSQPVQTPQLSGGNAGGNPVTAVVWNALRKRFYAAVRYHGYYESADGQTWTRLAHQPGAGLTLAACPTNANGPASTACPLFRGALAVQAMTGDLYALTVDGANFDQGLYLDACGLSGAACANSTVLFGTQLASTPLEAGAGAAAGAKAILQADYNLALAAVPAAAPADTNLYVGTIDLYRCTLTAGAGCTLRNTTNAGNGCTNPAGVAPAQHALAALPGTATLFAGNDGGVFRSTDGVNESGAACSTDDRNHFENLNAGLGSLAEVVNFAQDPADPAKLLAGLGALGSAGTGSASGSASGGQRNAWLQVAEGEGGNVAIDAANPQLWYVSGGAGVNIARCTLGAACTAAMFTTVIGPAQTANDASLIDVPWLLDPAVTSDLLLGTCRAWRGPAAGGALWTSANQISRPFGAPASTGCPAGAADVRSLAAGGPVSGSSNAQNAGSEVLYAGMAGVLDGGAGVGGHVFRTSAAQLASSATMWIDLAKSSVSNDLGSNGIFNPAGFDISSLAVDPRDATGATVYATVMGFLGNGLTSPSVYRSTDAGAHWQKISSNLPNAPANSIVVDPNDANTVYVALDTGVFVSTQIATCAVTDCWSVYGSALPNAPVTHLEAAAAMPTGDGRTGELRASTYGRGIWQIPLLTAIAAAAPGLAVSPVSITFPAQAIGSVSQSVTVIVTNTGSAPLNVTKIVTSSDFFEKDACVGVPIAPQATCSFQALFAPTAVGQRTGVLTVYGNAPGGQATVSLIGTGTPAPAIVLTPTSLVFASTTVGAVTAVQNITVSNTGGTVVNLQPPTVTGDFIIKANTCAASLAPNTGCTVSIAFAPTASGNRTGAFTQVDDAGTQVASLSGTGLAPATDSLSPLSLAFSTQQLNTVSAGQAVTLVNAGDTPLTLISAQITSGDFTVVNNCGTSLAGHSACTFAVAFAPHGLGARTGVLMVSDQFRSQAIQLSGTAVAPAGVSLAPTTGLIFAATPVGASTLAQTVTLTNNGGLPLTIQSVQVSGDFSILTGTNTCGAGLAPSAVCTVQVVFTPSAAGPRSGALSVTSNASQAPAPVQLSGVGVDFTLVANGPTSATIKSGETATYALLVSSQAGVPGTAGFTCAGVPAHALCTVNPPNPALSATTPVTVTVATGLSTARLDVPGESRTFWWALLVPTAFFFRRGKRRALCVLLVGLVLIGAGGCGAARVIPGTGGGTSGTTAPPTPSGTYNLVVSANNGGLVRSVGLTLVVQ